MEGRFVTIVGAVGLLLALLVPYAAAGAHLPAGLSSSARAAHRAPMDAATSAMPAPTATLIVPKPPCMGLPMVAPCKLGPCDRSPAPVPAHLPGPRLVHTPQGIPIRLQRLPGAAAVSGLAINGGWAAWTVPSIVGRRHTTRASLYLARLTGFHPSIISSPLCGTGIGQLYLSAHWLVWTEVHSTAFDLHGTLTIRAMALGSHRITSWSLPFNSQVLRPGIGFAGNTIIWTQQQWEGDGSTRSLVYGIYARMLPDGAVRPLQVIRERIGKIIPSSYIDGYVAPSIAGNLAVWERSRWQQGRPRTDIMAATLPRGPVRVLAWNGAESPVTNGWKVAWLALRGNSIDLVLLDTHTGKRKVVGRNVLPWTTSPQLGGTTLSWQLGRTGQSWRLLVARDLLSGRQYTLVHWQAAGAMPTPLKAIGPGRADGNRVVWEEIVREGTQKAAYLAVARLPNTM